MPVYGWQQADPGKTRLNAEFNDTVLFSMNATGLSFFNATPVAQQADISALTDNTGGTANNTLVAISATYDQTEIRDNFADLASQVNDIRTALRNLGLMA